MAVTERPVLLVLRALGLGDFLTAVPAYRALAAAFPEHRRLLAAPRSLAPLVPLAGGLDGLVAAAPLGLLEEVPDRVDVAVNLHGRGPESHRVLLATAPRRLLAFAHAGVPESKEGPEWREHEHEVQRWCGLLEAHGIPADPGALDLCPPPPVSLEPGYTLIHPGAGSGARRWPLARWAEVAVSERARGKRVLVTGGPGEERLAASLVARAELGTRSGRVGIDAAALAALVQGAGLVLCTDTGVGHLATALRRPSVLLFGPMSPALWGPPPDRPWHRVLWTGRVGDPHAETPDPGLLEIGVADVLAEIDSLRSGVLAPSLAARVRRTRATPPGPVIARRRGLAW